MKIKSRLLHLWAAVSFLLTVGLILFLFLFIFIKGAGAISWQFLTDVPRGLVLGTEGGILPAILGSLLFTLVAVLFASLLGVGGAIYRVFYCRSRRISSVVSLVMQCLAGVPSIVLGLFGYSLLVLQLGWGKCLLAGGITQGIMILPFIEVRAEKALRETEQGALLASYALGVSRAYTLRKVVLPSELPRLLSAVILGGLYATGAAAPLIFTGAVIYAKAPTSLMDPAMALPYHLYMLLTQGTSTEMAYGTAFVLMALVLLGNTLATFFAWRKVK